MRIYKIIEFSDGLVMDIKIISKVFTLIMTENKIIPR